MSAAISLGQAMELLHTQAGASTGEVKTMTAAVEKLGPAVGTTPEELAKGLFHVESAGFRGAKALSVLRVAAEGAKVGNADLEQTSTALVAAQKSGIVGTETLGKTMGALNAIVGAGNLRMDDLTAALGTGILPSARAAGVNLTDVGAALATLTTAGVPAQAAATRLRMTFALLGTQTPAAAKALRSIGIHTNQLGDSLRNKGLVPTLELLRTKLKQSGLTATQQASVITRAFGGGRSASTIQTLIQQLDNVKLKQASIASGSGSFTEKWQATMKTAAFASDRFHAAIAVIETTVGAALAPSFTKAANAVADWTAKSGNLAKLQRTLHQVISAVGFVVRGVAGGFRALDKITGSLRNTLILLTGAFVAFKAVKLTSSLVGLARNFGLIGRNARSASTGVERLRGAPMLGLRTASSNAAARVALLRGALLRLGALGLITVGVEVLMHRKQIDKAVSGFLEKHHMGFLAGDAKIKLPKKATAASLAPLLKAAKAAHDPFLVSALENAQAKLAARIPKPHADVGFRGVGIPAALKKAAAEAAALKKAAAEAAAKAAAAAAPPKLTLAQRQALIARRNQFFDSLTDRRLNRVQDVKSPQGQLAALTGIAASITARIAVTKDITRKQNLEDKLLDINRQQKDVRATIAQGFLDSLNFGVTKAEATAGLGDDLAALGKVRTELTKRLAADKTNLDLQQQLFTVNQQIKQTKIDARNAIQFKALGLTATGDEKAPGKKHLLAGIGALSTAVKGTVLDTPELRGKMAVWRKILAGGFGKVSAEVRQHIQQMVDGVNDKLKGHTGNLTKFAHTSSALLIKGLGLTPDQARALSSRIAQVGPGGTIPGQGAAFALAGAGVIEVHTAVHLNETKVGTAVTRHQQKAQKRRSGSRRGPAAGLH